MNINGKTHLLGLVGNPVEHTLSPVIHNTLADLMGINTVYVPFYVEKGELATAVAGAKALNVRGMNVTVPYKQEVMDSLVELHEVARAIGAVNTLVPVEGGYKGYNTDMPGLLRSITKEGVELKGESVIILGAGGAAKAVAYMCIEQGAKEVLLYNRSLDKAEEILQGLKTWFADAPMEARELEKLPELEGEGYIVFQCTSVGLSPHVNQVVVEDEQFYQKVKVGIDLIYNPANTRFMQMVTQAGGTAYNGLGMLLYQGIIAYELWENCQVSEEDAETVRDALYQSIYKTKDNLVLIGYMGTGKSTLGRWLAENKGMGFIDGDDYIEKKLGMTISEIFATKGEAYFRQIETQVIGEMLNTLSGYVISTGGGMPLRRENARLLRALGRVVYLDTSLDTIWCRIKNSTNRPLLKQEHPRQAMEEMLKYRTPIYKKACHVEVNTEGKSVEELGELLYQIYKEENNENLSN